MPNLAPPLLAIAASLLVAASGPTPLEGQPLDVSARQALKEAQAAEAQVAKLQKAADASKDEAAQLRARQAAAAEAISAAEARISAAGANARIIAAQLADRRARLAREQAPAASLLAGLALMSERPDLKITASDLSPEAVEAARENAERLGLDFDVRVAKGLPDDLGEVDLVIANLPYISDETIDQRSPEIHAEPLIAITGDCGADGLGVIRGLIAETPSGTKLALEHDTHHGPAMREMLRDAETLRDYEGNERVSVGLAP